MITVERSPLHRWNRPREETLRNQNFASDKPPFAPFPTVTNLMNANFCPMAIWHDMIHGIDHALLGDYYYQNRGEIFNKFISHTKLSIRRNELTFRGDRNAFLQLINTRFIQFARDNNVKHNEIIGIWNSYIEPYINRKINNEEIISITPQDNIFFEISIANYNVPFVLNGGVRNYPLMGRIDEIDITHHRIIERTIKPEIDENTPPLLKDYQLWLYWKILCSLSNDKLPSDWKGIDFNDFELIVETPSCDFIIPNDNERFELETHWAYAWINDISTSERSRQIFQDVMANELCAPENPNANCGHPFINCYPKRYAYPQCRPEIRRVFQPWFKLLLWEQMWAGHLWNYQLLMLESNELLELGIIEEARIVSAQNNEVELEIVGNGSTLSGYEYCLIIPYGTVFCGLKLKARLQRTGDNRLIASFDDDISSLSDQALLMISPDVQAPITKDRPIFLDRKKQAALFRLKHIGTQDLEKAQNRSLIQFLEAVFGTRTLRRGRENE